MYSTLKNKTPSLPVIFLGLFITAIGVGCGGGGGGTPTPPAPTTFTVGGSITGLSNTGLVLQNNGGDDLNISAANSTFTFATSLSTNSAYAVGIQTQPVGQNCNISNNSGTVTNANITDVAITCDTVTANDASGLYTGTTGSATVGFVSVNGGVDFDLDFIRGIIYDNRFLFFNVDPKGNTLTTTVTNQNENIVIDGKISSIEGTTITATASIYQAGRIVANDVPVTGTVTSRTNISLTFTDTTAVTGAPAGNFNGGTLDATFSMEFDREASDARVDSPSNRNWGFGLMRDVYMYLPATWSSSLDFNDTNDTYRFVIFNNQRVFPDPPLSPSQTCDSLGTSTFIPNNSINIYALTVTMNGLTLCDELDSSPLFTGFSAVVDVVVSADTIWYVTTNGTHSIYAVLNR